MNQLLEKKLMDCLAAAEQQGAPDAFLVLHMLIGNYRGGSQREFARHCAAYAGLRCQVTVADNDERPAPAVSEFPTEWDACSVGNYLN